MACHYRIRLRRTRLNGEEQREAKQAMGPWRLSETRLTGEILRGYLPLSNRPIRGGVESVDAGRRRLCDDCHT